MKKTIKYFVVFILSFLSVLFSKDGLNILFTIPLFAFFMFNGISSFIVSIAGLLSGSLVYYILSSSYSSLLFLLIGMTFYFCLYLLNNLIHKKLILNYFISVITSIEVTYLLYQITNDCFSLSNLAVYLFLAVFITTLFAYLIKKFSFHLLTVNDHNASLLIYSLLIIYVSQLSNLFSNSILSYITISIILCIFIYFSVNNHTLNVLAINSLILVIAFFFNIDLILHYFYLIIPLSVIISFNKTFKNYFNCFISLTVFIILYFILNPTEIILYFSCALVVSISPLFIKPVHKVIEKDKFFLQYSLNKETNKNQLTSFEMMFKTLSTNFILARQSKILTKVKQDVFDLMCHDCPQCEACFKKGKHILLNYIKYSLTNSVDDDKLRYIKQNCLKQKMYFTLLDQFTNTYLLNEYKKEEQSRLKEILASDFYSFSKVMNMCVETYSKDRLLIESNFYKNIKSKLETYGYDVLFVNNQSKDDAYMFDIAIKDIKKNQINDELLSLINETLNTKVEIVNIDTATLTSNYFIISIQEKPNNEFDFASKQSNEDLKTCGDTIKIQELKEHIFMSISDGMGHGIDANEESKFTIDTLYSLLKCNIDIASSITITNDIIQLKNDFETYTTLDLCSINKKELKATFYKYGAFNSYIIRNHRVIEVTNYSLPLGIVDYLDVKPFVFQLQKKDIILMCSDGMIDDTDHSIINTLEDLNEDSASVMCNTLFNYFIEKRQNGDDASLIIIKVK